MPKMKQIIRSIRKGNVQWNEEDRLEIGKMLLKSGYIVWIRRREVPGQNGKKNAQMEYVIEYWEEEE